MFFQNLRSAVQYSEFEMQRRETMSRRRYDWRVGSVVYQVIVDRFAPSTRLKEKKEHYASPRKLLPWNAKPKKGKFLADHKISEQELEFWGGDLQSLSENLDYIQSLGVDVLYLNPLFHAFSNHKYDAMDYFNVDPQYGTNAELHDLVQKAHEMGMKVILDGVLNHMSQHAPIFQDALTNPNSQYRDFFVIHDELNHGYRGWRKVANLPELNLEHPAVREYVYQGYYSVVQNWIREYNIDGWRLDVAPDLGFHTLQQITETAHNTKPGSVVIGECWNYPEEWLGVVDGVMNMHTRELLLCLARDQVSVLQFACALETMLRDCNEDGLLKSHLILDNHDTPRIATEVSNEKRRKALQFLQFTLPGSPVIYYGSENGMKGGHDPLCRAPMDWKAAADQKNKTRQWISKLVKLREDNPALRIGNTRVLETCELLGFLRTTDIAVESLIIIVNFSDQTIEETIPIRESRLMDAAPFECQVTGTEARLHSGLMTIVAKPWSVHIFRSKDRGNENDYSMFKRVM